MPNNKTRQRLIGSLGLAAEVAEMGGSHSLACLLFEARDTVKNYGVTRRIDLLRDMPAETLALYLKNELDDSLPTDWLAWLLEEL